MNDWISSLYFAIVSMLTIGYGDISPGATLSKMFTVVVIILGAIWSALFIIYAVGMLEFREEEFRSYACTPTANTSSEEADPSAGTRKSEETVCD